ncbi:hypothetical protein [Bradyrhizobium sp. WSM1417]|uniref:hypothetical protein n=1 Tax=Bradyrhizobium sp. WSM1417 TaxID=754500 RepID=UPI0004B1A65E|nr:hypothetical protein [Bradyrhizobium sp. WSM1417]
MRNPTRRKFLGLLAAAPVVAPMVAQAAAARKLYFSGGISGLSGEFLVGEACGESLLTPAQMNAFDAVLSAPAAPNEALRRLMSIVPPWSIPNRLYGARINDDGDAV